MAGFSAADAALGGFRIVAERPWAVAIWAVLQFVVSLGVALIVATTAGPAYTRLLSLGLQPADPAEAMQLMGQVAPTYFLLLVISLVFYAVLFAAMNRAVLRPAESAFGYLRLSLDELRQLGLFILLFAIAMGVYLVLGIASFLIAMVVALAAGPGVAVSALVALLIPGLIAAFVFVGVRLSLASPLAFDRGRIDLGGAWRMSHDRFWPMLGTYLIAFALAVVVLVLTFAITVVVVAVAGGGLGAIGPVLQSDLSSPTSLVAPLRLLYVALVSIGQALSWPILLAPPASVYKALAGASPAASGQVFA